MPKTHYRINGAGDVFRKIGKKVTCWYHGAWVGTIFKDTWDCPVLKSITEEKALKIVNKK